MQRGAETLFQNGLKSFSSFNRRLAQSKALVSDADIVVGQKEKELEHRIEWLTTELERSRQEMNALTSSTNGGGGGPSQPLSPQRLSETTCSSTERRTVNLSVGTCVL